MNLPISGAGIRQTFSNRFIARLIVAYGLDRIAAWLVTLAAVILAYRFTLSIGVAAAVILVQVLGRTLVIMASGQSADVNPVLVTFAGIVRVGAIAGLVLFDSQTDIWWAILLIGLASASTGVVETGYSQLIPLLGQRKRVPSLNRSIGTCEQICAVVGPVLTAIVLVLVDERAAFAAAAVLSYVSLSLFRRMFAELGPVGSSTSSNSGEKNPFAPEDWRVPQEIRAVITGLVAMAVLGIVVRLTLLEVVIDNLEYAGAVYALLIALVGIGALTGPMPVDRVLGHFPVTLVLAGGVCAVAVATVILSVGGPLIIVVPALLATGIVIVTLDITASVTLRRAVPEWATSGVNETLMRLILVGQVIALLVVLGLERAWDVRMAALVVSFMCALAVGVHFLRSGGLRLLRGTSRADSDKSAPGKSAS